MANVAKSLRNRLLQILGERPPQFGKDAELLVNRAAGEVEAREVGWSEATDSFKDSNTLYNYLEGYFKYRSPAILREHRDYFKLNQRGFGEDAFHAMWWLLFLECRPEKCLEIGVYRGQVISLWALISKMIQLRSEIWGVSPLKPANDSVSKYLESIDYELDICCNFSHFHLPRPNILKALSTDEVARDFVQSQLWDLIYIDGSHDEHVVLSDYLISRDSLRQGGLLVFDDAALEFEPVSRPERFNGHPGPSKIARQHAANEMELIAVVGHNVVFRKV